MGNKLTVGQIVKSKAGRDKDRDFIVLEVIDDNYVYLVDGDLRKLDNPKKKKVKHLSHYNIKSQDFINRLNKNIKINNAYIRKLLDTITDGEVED